MDMIEELKAQLTSLEKELAKEEKIVEKKQKEINSNPEMIKLIEERRELGKEHVSIQVQKEKLEKKIKEQFIEISSPYTSPNFQHKTSDWGEETNIFDDVLSEIGKYSHLYLLRNEDIENAVRTLIDKAMNKCPELVKLKNRYDILNKRINKLWEDERSLDKKLMQDFHSRTYDLQQKIFKIKQQIVNPKKFIEQQKRYNKRDEARGKLKDPKILDEIYKKLEIEIPKIKSKIKVKKR